jgi:predicted  nucleic acid-binding Zn-ribbon protein
MSKAFLEHSHFEELCMLASVGQISAPEYQELSDHLRECPRCRDSYADFLRLTHEELPLLAAEEATTPQPAGLIQGITSKNYKARFAARARERGIEISPGRSRRTGAWSLSPSLSYKLGSAVVIVTLVTMMGLMSHRWKSAESRNAALSEQVSSLAEQNTALQQKVNQLSGSNQTNQSDVTKTREKTTTDAAQLRDLQDLVAKDNLAIRDLQTQLSSSKMQAAGSEQELRDAQQSLVSLNEEVGKLQDSHADDTASLVTQQVQIADLTRQAKDSADVIDKQQKLLAVDEDVRNLMAARNLHITDVFDVGGNGARRSAFGRVFYTEGKSLIFYAFDLDGPKLADGKHSFQAWAQLTDSKTSAVNLGIFYVDDPANKRWILRFDNPEVLDKISAVFVTAEPHGGTSRPTGQKLMFAYLGHAPNHP